MIVQQTLSAFNDKTALFLLIPLGGWLVGKASKVELVAGLIVTLPVLLFAPLAGWLSDRYPKRDVIIGCAIAQVLLLLCVCAGIWQRNLPLTIAAFFALAVQAVFFSPAKMGIVKELVGSRHLGFASGVQQMTATLAMLAGQILSGPLFDGRLERSGDGWQAALGPLMFLSMVALPAIALTLLIPRTPRGVAEAPSARLAVRHLHQLQDLWRDPVLRRTSCGIAFFWAFAGFINLWAISVAKEETSGAAGFGTISSEFLAAASVGMVAGFGTASLLMRRRIELGWVPVAGLAMTFSTLLLAFPHPSSTAFLVILGFTGFFSAVFLTPLNAFLQDRCPPGRRGEILAATSLQECLAGIAMVCLLYAAGLLRVALGNPWWFGLNSQLVVAAIACGAMTLYIGRLIPADLVRVVGLTFIRLFYKIRTSGEFNLPAKGGVLLLPNHITWADAFFLTAASPRPVRFVMEQGFMGQTAIRVFCQLFDTVPITTSKPREALRASADALKRGDVVCLFPEGQLTRTGTLRELKRGFEIIARQAACPLVPVWTDGAWGSIFSFEGNRFFKKIPHRLRYGISIAFGPPIAPDDADPALIRRGMLAASATALDARVGMPHSDRRSARANALQIAHVNALPRGGDFGVLAGDPLPASLPGLDEYVRIFKTIPRPASAANPATDLHWLGGDALREHLEVAPPSGGGGVFFDFSERAALPLSRTDWLHCPCLAIDGIVVAMSMPDPPSPHDTVKPQVGHKPGALGILLPGFAAEEKEGRWIVSGPSAPQGLPLPVGLVFDDEGFIVPRNAPES